MAKRVLISGITGMDGATMAELLLSEGYEVYGIVRRISTPNTWRIDHIKDRLHLIEGDLLDSGSLMRALEIAEPEIVVNLAAQSFVKTSWDQPVLTNEITGTGCLRFLEAIRQVNAKIRFYQASSSELFGNAPAPQNELTPFQPRSPYGVAKLAAHWYTRNYRESYGMFAISGILFNHCNGKRGIEFVERKITDGVARIVHGKQKKLYLGNLDAKRDFGHSADYMRAALLLLQKDIPMDVVIGTGETHTIREVCEVAFAEVDLDYRDYVEIDPKFFRPAEVNCLLADASLARKELGWEPRYTFREIIREMVAADMKRQSEI